jgi:hypothetical protein
MDDAVTLNNPSTLEPRRWTRASLILLVAATCATFAPTLRNRFILDDDYIVVRNAPIEDLRNVPSFFVSTPPGSINRNYYRPVMLTSFAIDYALFGLNPIGFHAVNILLHACNVALVFLLLRAMLGNVSASFLSALVFGVHPLQGEVVYLVNYRGTSLSACFFLTALLYYLHRRAQRWNASSTAALGLLYFCSMASKEIGVTLPAAMLLMDLLLPTDRKPVIAPYIGCVLAAGLYFGLRHVLCEPSSASYFGSMPASEVVMAMLVVEAYAVGRLFLPMNLAATYDRSYLPHPTSVGDPVLLLSLGLLLVLVVLAWQLRHRAPLISLAIAFYFLALTPTYQLIRLPILFGERFLYLPLFGLCLFLGVVLSKPRRPAWAMSMQAAIVTVCVIFAIESHARAADWSDAESFWRATVRARPASLQAHIGLASTLRSLKRCKDALPHYAFALGHLGASLSDRPVYGEAASCYSFAGDFEHSRAVIERWLASHPDDAGFRAMLASLTRGQSHAPSR